MGNTNGLLPLSDLQRMYFEYMTELIRKDQLGSAININLFIEDMTPSPEIQEKYQGAKPPECHCAIGRLAEEAWSPQDFDTSTTATEANAKRPEVSGAVDISTKYKETPQGFLSKKGFDFVAYKPGSTWVIDERTRLVYSQEALIIKAKELGWTP